MLSDIIKHQVENIAIAVVLEQTETGQDTWNVYLLNLKNEPIHNVLITSKGYGSINDEPIKTSVLRHYFYELKSMEALKIEPIMDNLFGLNNEYWVSFYVKREIFEKKFIFLPETIKQENFTLVPILNKRGVMI